MQIFETASGIKYGALGSTNSPKVTVLNFAGSLQGSLSDDAYAHACRLLRDAGCLCISLDLPCHGADVRLGEPEGLHGWRARIEAGQGIVDEFVSRCADVIDDLIGRRWARAGRIGTCGTSRGAFMSMHLAAADARVVCAAAFAPVTDLLALSEFSGAAADVGRLALVNRAAELASKDMWICISSNDTRVGTDNAVHFARQVAREADAAGLEPRVELRVVTGEPHPMGHLVHADAHQEAAAWMASRLGLSRGQNARE